MEEPVKRDDSEGRDNKGRFTKNNPGGGRTPMDPEVREMLAAKSKYGAQRLIEALDATRAVVVPGGGKTSGHVEYVPDWDLRVKVASILFDRLYGKPSQEITGEDGGAVKVEVSVLSMLQRIAELKP